MKVYEYISLYNGTVALVTISTVMIVFLSWQLRRRRRRKHTTGKE